MKKRSGQVVEEAYHELQATAKAENAVVKQMYKQVTPTFSADDDSIWSKVYLLIGRVGHRHTQRKDGVRIKSPLCSWPQFVTRVCLTELSAPRS